MNEKQPWKLKTKLQLVFLFGVAIFVIFDFSYTIWTKRNSQFRYTVVELTDLYIKGRVHGKEIRYQLNGETYVDHCSDAKCRGGKIGDKYFIKVYLEDPEVFEIIWTNKVNLADSVPREGWIQIPRPK